MDFIRYFINTPVKSSARHKEYQNEMDSIPRSHKKQAEKKNTFERIYVHI